VELIRALAVLGEPPGPEHRRLAEALELGVVPEDDSHLRLFQFQLYPFASVYLGAEGMLGGEARSRIGGFWTAVGRTPPPEPDHLSALLGLYAGLLVEGEGEGPRSRLARRAAIALLHEHLASWCFPYLARVSEFDQGFYGRWAGLLQATLEAELETSGSPEELPAHLREAPTLPDPREQGGEVFLEGLLAPVRTGMILTRADLSALATRLELGLRVGERRYILEHLLAQDAGPVLGDLAIRAAKAAEGHGVLAGALGVVARFWEDRAVATAGLLSELARDSDQLPLDRNPSSHATATASS
jgi:hypothetical protein